MAHYLELFDSPDAYIVHRISLNMGTESCMDKMQLMKLAEENGCPCDPSMSKEEIAEMLIKRIGAKALAKKCNHMGVSGYSFQQKFGITNADVKMLAQVGFLKVTGIERYGTNGRYCYANLYSVFQYFQLTQDKVQKLLAVCKKKRNLKNEAK